MSDGKIEKSDGSAVAVTGQEEFVDKTLSKIQGLIATNGLHLPADYSPDNAVRSAFLILLETLDRNKKPALEVCTKASVAYALFDMVSQGLNAQKKQCYFIVYGKKLICQRSYFGNMTLARRADPLIDKINSQVIYKDDDFEIGMRHGEAVIVKHSPTLASMASRDVIGAYCVMIDKQGNARYTDVLSIEQIKSAWKMSKMSPVDDKGNVKSGSTHSKYIEEMAKKTVINHACKAVVNSSGDAYLVDAIESNNQTVSLASAEVLAIESENQTLIDIKPADEIVSAPVAIDVSDDVDDEPSNFEPATVPDESDISHHPAF